MKQFKEYLCAVIGASVLMLSMFVSVAALSAPQAGKHVGSIEAINVNERKVVVNGTIYRVALAARVKDSGGKNIGVEGLELKAAIEFELDKETDDILDMTVLAMP